MSDDSLNHCEHLGLKVDPETSCSFPSPANCCFSSGKPVSVNLEHQIAYCLCEQYRICPVYLEKAISDEPQISAAKLDSPLPVSNPNHPSHDFSLLKGQVTRSPNLQNQLPDIDTILLARAIRMKTAESQMPEAGPKLPEPPARQLPPKRVTRKQAPAQRPGRALLLGLFAFILLSGLLVFIFFIPKELPVALGEASSTAAPATVKIEPTATQAARAPSQIAPVASSTKVQVNFPLLVFGQLTPTTTVTLDPVQAAAVPLTKQEPTDAPAPAAIEASPTPQPPSETPVTPSPTACYPKYPSTWVKYTVQKGDTLYSLSQAYNASVAQLQTANCLPPSGMIYIGQVIYVPYTPTSTHTQEPAPEPAPTETPLPPSDTPIPDTDTPVPPTVYPPPP